LREIGPCKKKLYDEMARKISELQEEITGLKQVNKSLTSYVKALEKKGITMMSGEEI